MKTTRRTALSAALGAILAGRRTTAAFQELGKIEPDSALSWFPPLPAAREDWPRSILSYADIAGYWEERGGDRPRSFDDETGPQWLEISQRVPLNDGILFLYMTTNWAELVGFEPWDVDEVAVAFDPPDQVRVYTGAFDPERIAERLGAAGYTAHADGAFTILDSGSDELDLTSDLGRITLGSFNHLAVSDTIVIAARSPELRSAALAIATDDGESLGDLPELADIASLLPDFHGCAAAYDPQLSPVTESEDDADPAPASSTGVHLAGFRAGKGDGMVSLIAAYADAGSAGAAVARVSDRIEHELVASVQIPYTDLLGPYEIDVVPGTSLLRIDLAGEQFGIRWMQFLYSGDFVALLAG